MAVEQTVRDYVSLTRGITYKGHLVGRPGPALLGLGSICPGGGFREGDYKTYGGDCPPKLMLTPGDLFVSLKGATKDGKMIGSVARVPPSVPSGRLTQDTVKLEFLSAEKARISSYLYWLLRTPQYRAYCEGRAMGSAVVSLSRDDFLDYPVPSFTRTREGIVEVLERIEDKIELNRRMNATLEAMARALFQSWFVDFDPVRARLDGRQPGGLDPGTAALFPEHLEDSPLGKVPIGWEVTTLESVLSVLETGGRPKGGVAGIMSGVPSIGAESIVSVGVFDFGKTKYVPIEFYERMKKGRIESHDVLLYKDGGRPGEYEPHVSMFGDEFPFEECSINEHVYRLRSNDHLSQEYLYFWMTSEFALAEMRIKGTGVAIPGLNSTAVRSLAVLVPPQPIVEAFTNQASPLVTRILSNAKQSRILATLRDTLLPKLLSGELQVPEAIRLIEAQA